MANVLGSLLIELGINSAAFVEGMSRATYQAKAGAQQIGASFSAIGGQIASVGAHFGEFGTIVGEAMATVGENVTKLVHHMGDLSGAAGAAKIGAIGLLALGAGAATAGAAIVGIAVHASEAAARLYQLSQSTGVAVKDLSGLGIVGQLVGLNIEVLAKGLERMDRSALMAAKSPNAANNAYRQLGISVLDVSGHLKPTTELFGEVADKFSHMEDSATKTALAMQMFGRAGAELIPILNKGSEALKYWMDYGAKVGAVLDEKAAAGAEAFHNELTKLELISTGVQNKLMTALMPALDHVVAMFTTLVGTGPAVSSFGSIVSKVILGLAGAFLSLIEDIQLVIDKWTDLKVAADKFEVKHTWFFGGEREFPGMTDKQRDDMVAQSKAQLQKAEDQIALARADLESKVITPPGPEGPKRTGKPPIPQQPETAARPEKNYAMDLVSQTELATAAEIARAAAIGQSTAALLIQKGAEDALQKIAQVKLQISDRLKMLSEEEASAVKAGSSKKIAAIREQEDALNRQLGLLDQSKQKMVALFDTKEVAAFAVSTTGAFEKQNEQLAQQIVLSKALTAARFQGGQAEVDAGTESKLAKDKESLATLTEAYDRLSQVQGVDATQLATLGTAVAQASAQIDRHRALLKQDYDITIANAAAKLNLAATARNEQLGYTQTAKALQENIADTKELASAMLLLKAQQQGQANALTTQWDNAALSVGTYEQKFKAVMNELALESQNTGKNIAAAFKTALDGVSTEFAKMVTTGKFNFGQLFDSLEQAVIKALASAALNALIQKLAGLGGGSGGSTGGGGGIGGFFSTLVSGIFGGGKAGGGGVSPGVSYLVGEQGPEILRMGSAGGTIVPNAASIPSSPMQSPNINVHVHGASDPDTFRKATPQIAAAMYQNLRAAYARNGGG